MRRYLQRLKQNIHRQLILNALQIVFVLFGFNEIFHVVILFSAKSTVKIGIWLEIKFYFQPKLCFFYTFGWE
jgi:hypothetical protein